jgi:hypothetical protein
MSQHERHLAARIGWLKSRERLLIRCCHDYERDIERLQSENEALRRSLRGRDR